MNITFSIIFIRPKIQWRSNIESIELVNVNRCIELSPACALIWLRSNSILQWKCLRKCCEQTQTIRYISFGGHMNGSALLLLMHPMAAIDIVAALLCTFFVCVFFCCRWCYYYCCSFLFFFFFLPSADWAHSEMRNTKPYLYGSQVTVRLSISCAYVGSFVFKEQLSNWFSWFMWPVIRSTL